MFKSLSLLALVLVVAMVPGPVRADSPSGIINIELHSLTGIADMGGTWLDGTFSFQGKTNAVKMRGLQSSIVGVRDFYARGEVYNLRKASDLAGNYRMIDPAGVTFLTDEKGLVIQNDKGVVINLRVFKKRLVGVMRTIFESARKRGMPLDLVPEGLTIQLMP